MCYISGIINQYILTMKKLYYLLSSLMLLSSCYFDDKGDPHLSGWFIFVLVLILAFVIYAVISGITGTKQVKEELSKQNLQVSDFIPIGDYLGGHIDLDNGMKGCRALIKEDRIAIYLMPNDFETPIYKASIQKDSITDIQIEDESTIDKKITLGRVLLVGVFALAWRKNKKKEAAYLSIMWNDGKYTHNTIFGFENENAFQKANTARNKLIQGTKN